MSLAEQIRRLKTARMADIGQAIALMPDNDKLDFERSLYNLLTQLDALGCETGYLTSAAVLLGDAHESVSMALESTDVFEGQLCSMRGDLEKLMQELDERIEGGQG